MSFFDLLSQFGLGASQNPMQVDNPYGLDDGMMRQARIQSLSNLGGQIMAASMPMTQAQRANMMSNMDFTGGYQTNLYNAAQMKLFGDKARQSQKDDQRDQAAQAWLQQKIASMPDSQQKQNAMIYLQLGDVQKAAEMLTATPAGPEYQIVDGYYVNKNDPSAPAIPIQGMPQGPQAEPVNPKDRLAFSSAYDSDPQVQAYNVIASTLSDLDKAVYDNSKVSDLKYIYGVAKALDPSSVVKESEGRMVIEAQGLDSATLGRLNGLLGGGTLNAQQRLELANLVRSRGQSLQPFVKSKRDNLLRVGAGTIDDTMLQPIMPLSEAPDPPPQQPAPGRVNLPRPQLLRVDP